MTLSTELPRFLHMIGEAFMREPLSRQAKAYQAERRQQLVSLRAFEGEVVRLRSLLREKKISIWAIDKSFREWCSYSDAHYYVNMEARYRRLRFDDDADRVAKMAKSGSKKTTVTEDVNGNITSETIATGSTVSNAVEFDF